MTQIEHRNWEGKDVTEDVTAVAERVMGQTGYYSGEMEGTRQKVDQTITVVASLMDLLADKGVLDDSDLRKLLGLQD